MPEPPDRFGRTGLIIALIVMSLVAVVSTAVAIRATMTLDSISACDGGYGVSSCPAYVGAWFEELGKGESISGGFFYKILEEPVDSPSLNADSLSLHVFNQTTNRSVALLNMTLTNLAGSPLAVFGSSGNVWSTSSAVALNQFDLVTFSSPAKVAGDTLSIAEGTQLTLNLELR